MSAQDIRTKRLIFSPAPHIHSGASISGTMMTFIIALLPALIFGISSYGMHAARVVAVAVRDIGVEVLAHVLPAVQEVGAIVVEADELEALSPGGAVGIGPLEKLLRAVGACLARRVGHNRNSLIFKGLKKLLEVAE